MIIRADNSNLYNPYVWGLGKVLSVTTLVTNSRAGAVAPTVLGRLANASAVFIAGGAQNVYMDYVSMLIADIPALAYTSSIRCGRTAASLHLQRISHQRNPFNPHPRCSPPLQWNNTQVQTILRSKSQTVPIGGTSAGMAVLVSRLLTSGTEMRHRLHKPVSRSLRRSFITARRPSACSPNMSTPH